MLSINTMNIARFVTLLFFTLVLSACGGGSSGGTTTPSNDEQSNSITVRFSAPVALESNDNVEPNQLVPEVRIDGEIVGGFQRLSDGSWSRVKTLVPMNGSVNFSIIWSIIYAGKTLDLGSVEELVNVSSNTETVTISQSSLVTSTFDDDGDGISNINELAQRLDPFTFDENLVPSSLRVKITIPDVDYAGNLEVSAVWNGQQIPVTNSGLVYEGIIRNLTPSEGEVRVFVHAGSDRTLVYRYQISQYTVNEGENSLVVIANQFTADALKLKITAAIPNKNYRGNYKVTFFDLSADSSSLLSSQSRTYTKTITGVKAGSKQMAVEIRSTDSDVLWARAEKNYTVRVGANAVSFAESDFSFTYDSDGDGTSNINDAEPTVANIDVYIPYAANGTPIIDGVYDDVPWGASTSIDASGEKLRINNLMIEKRQAGGLEDNDDVYEEKSRPWHTWRAMYDDNYLYLLVEVTQDAYPTCDSADPWDDDDLNIYWDGDNSKGDKYDGVNDFHLMIPLFERGEDCLVFNNNGRMNNGVNSAAIAKSDDLRYAAGTTGLDTYIYEVRIGLNKAGIKVGKIFGFDVHIDDDDDGGDRDQKWGWKHPARGSSDVDETYKNPKAMANVRLN